LVADVPETNQERGELQEGDVKQEKQTGGSRGCRYPAGVDDAPAVVRMSRRHAGFG
jgi:hypothetical protein